MPTPDDYSTPAPMPSIPSPMAQGAIPHEAPEQPDPPSDFSAPYSGAYTTTTIGSQMSTINLSGFLFLGVFAIMIVLGLLIFARRFSHDFDRECQFSGVFIPKNLWAGYGAIICALTFLFLGCYSFLYY